MMRSLSGADLLAKLAAEHKLWFKADGAHVKLRGKARTANRRLMDRIEEREHRLIQRFLALPIVSLADVQTLLQFMGRECQELVPCPSNDRQDDLTRSFDLLVAAVDKIAGQPAPKR
jgi:hypothetical protein